MEKDFGDRSVQLSGLCWEASPCLKCPDVLQQEKWRGSEGPRLRWGQTSDVMWSLQPRKGCANGRFGEAPVSLPPNPYQLLLLEARARSLFPRTCLSVDYDWLGRTEAGSGQ